MCGLVGAYYFDRSTAPSELLLERAVRALGHRGPDASGRHVAPGIALGHSRLSLLDLTPEGNQPMWDHTQRYCIVYNGEIYNFSELRTELEARGYRFRTVSDTEVLMYGLIEFGPVFLERCNGMFACALYDSQQHTLLLARDRFGIKPLFWSVSSQGVMFASEMKALRAWMDFSPDERSLAAFLGGFDLPTSGATFVDNIRFFPIGSSASIGPHDGLSAAVPFFQTDEFWDPELTASLAAAPLSHLVDRFDEMLNESVRLHMISDVPVGALCSGGVDSSLILALAKRHSSSLAIYHADVLGPQSEYQAARQLSEFLKLDLVKVQVGDQEFIDDFAEVISQLEFPFLYHPNSIPFLRVTKLVQSGGTKAVLTGEGADETLLGYSYIPLRHAIRRYHGAIDSLRSLVHRIPFLGSVVWRVAGDSQARLGRLMTSGFEGIVAPESAVHHRNDDMKSMASHLLGYHLRTLLMRNDRLGMASSIEARFPYLEHELVRFCVNLPNSVKIRASLSGVDEIRHPFITTKWILRQVAARYLPRSLAFRAKRGFPTSAFERIRVAPDFLERAWVTQHYGLDRTALSFLRTSATSTDLLRLVMLEAWAMATLNGESIDRVRATMRACLSIDPIEKKGSLAALGI